MLLLEQVKALLADPNHWTQYTYARDRNNLRVHPSDPSACRWCLLGAIQKVSGLDPETHPARFLLEDLIDITVTSFNDTSSHDDVMNLLDQAIEEEPQ